MLLLHGIPFLVTPWRTRPKTGNVLNMNHSNSNIDWAKIQFVSSCIVIATTYVSLGIGHTYVGLQDPPGWLVRTAQRCPHTLFMLFYCILTILLWPLIALYACAWLIAFFFWALAYRRTKSQPGCISRAVKEALRATAFAPRYCRRKITRTQRRRPAANSGPRALPRWVSTPVRCLPRPPPRAWRRDRPGDRTAPSLTRHRPNWKVSRPRRGGNIVPRGRAESSVVWPAAQDGGPAVPLVEFTDPWAPSGAKSGERSASEGAQSSPKRLAKTRGRGKHPPAPPVTSLPEEGRGSADDKDAEAETSRGVISRPVSPRQMV